MRWLILLLIFGAGIVFFISNQQPVTLIFFGGILTATMPIALWILLFIASGILTSLLFQLLNLRPQSTSKQKDYSSQIPPYSPPPPKKPPVSRSPSSNNQPSPSISAKKVDADWQRRNVEEEEDWLIEEAPSQPTPIQDEVRDSLGEKQSPKFEVPQQPKVSSQQGSVYSYTYREPKESLKDSQIPPVEATKIQSEATKIQEESPEYLPEKPSPNFETSQQPQSVSREGSIYSYTYRERKKHPQSSPKILPSQGNSVYDADYRVITPPYREQRETPSQEDDNEEDWI